MTVTSLTQSTDGSSAERCWSSGSRNLLRNPTRQIQRVRDFLSVSLDVQRMEDQVYLRGTHCLEGMLEVELIERHRAGLVGNGR